MDWTRIKEKLAIKEEMTDDNAEALILSQADAFLEKYLALSHDEAEPMAPQLLALSQKDRRRTISDLMRDGKITRACGQKLEKAYVDTLELSHGEDNFDAVTELLRENDPVQLKKERTGPQALSLGNDMGDAPKKNALVANAEKRAAKGAKS